METMKLRSAFKKRIIEKHIIFERLPFWVNKIKIIKTDAGYTVRTSLRYNLFKIDTSFKDYYVNSNRFETYVELYVLLHFNINSFKWDFQNNDGWNIIYTPR